MKTITASQLRAGQVIDLRPIGVPLVIPVVRVRHIVLPPNEEYGTTQTPAIEIMHYCIDLDHINPHPSLILSFELPDKEFILANL